MRFTALDDEVAKGLRPWRQRARLQVNLALDGTLVDTASEIAEAANRALESHAGLTKKSRC